MNISSGAILNAHGQPFQSPARGVGRPRNADQIDYSQEYALGGTFSQYPSVYGMNALMRLYGNVDDMDLRLGWNAKEEMDNDPFCSAALDTLYLGATARPAEVEPASKSTYLNDDDEAKAAEIASFVRRDVRNLKDNYRDLNLISYQMGRTSGKIGHVKAERVTDTQKSGVDAGKRMTQRIKVKNRFNTSFVIDARNNVVGVAAFTGNYAEYKNPYDVASLNGYLPYSLLGAGWELLPRDKWVVITNNPPDDDSPLGKSLYRAAYTAFRMKRDLWPMYIKALDNTALPFIVANRPETQYDVKGSPLVNGVPDPSKPDVPMSHIMFDAINEARQAGVAVLPHGADVKAIYSAQSGDPFMVARSVFNSEITQAILLQSLATGTDRHMARSAGEVHQDVLDVATRHFRRQICDALDRDYVQPLVRDNFPARYWHLTPHISFGEVELNDFAAWAEAFSKLAQAGLLHVSQFPHIWAVLGLPQGDLKSFYADLLTDNALLEKMQDPVGTGGTPTEDSAAAPSANAPDAAATDAALQSPTLPPAPSQMQKFASQEMGKALLRRDAKQRIGRSGTVFK